MTGKEEGGGRGAAKRSLFRGGVLSAFGQRDYAVYWSGALISNTGSWVQTAALLWVIKNVFKSNAWVGAVNMASFLPVLILVPLAGSLADRYDRRRLILAGQFVMMAGALVLGLTASLEVFYLPVIMVTVSVVGVAFALTFPAQQSFLPDLVPGDDLLNAVALSSAQWNLARFIGPLVGAAVLAVYSAATAFYIDAASFLFVIAALLAIKPRAASMPAAEGSVGDHIVDGWKYAWSHRWMVNLLIALGVVSFFGFSYIVLIPSLIKDVLGGGGGRYGFLLGMTGLGAFLGAPLVTYLSRRFRERNIIKVSMLGLGFLLIAFAASRAYWLSCLISVGLGGCFLVSSSAANSVLQQNSERLMRGRIVGLYIMVYVGVSAVGGQLMGYISDWRSTPFALAIGGAACVLVALVLAAFPGLIRGAVSPRLDEAGKPILTYPRF